MWWCGGCGGWMTVVVWWVDDCVGVAWWVDDCGGMVDG